MAMARGGYNYIYKELVADESDILGKLAYSSYKRQKIEYIQAFISKHGKDPTDSDLTAFHDISNNASQLDVYRNQAAKLAVSFLETSFAMKQKSLRSCTQRRRITRFDRSGPHSGQAYLKASLAQDVSFCWLGV
jgi:hypothetical protein